MSFKHHELKKKIGSQVVKKLKDKTVCQFSKFDENYTPANSEHLGGQLKAKQKRLYFDVIYLFTIPC